MQNKTTLVLAIGDVHDSPVIPSDRFIWLGKLANEARPDYIVQIGDFLSFDSLNTHEKNETGKGKLKPAFLEDVNHFELSLDLFDLQLSPNYRPRKHITLGNHEARLFSFEDKNPETAGLMRNKFFGVLNNYHWSSSPYGAYHNIKGVDFTHVPFNKMGKPASSIPSIANKQTRDLVFGHTHVKQEFRDPKNNDCVTVINLGCALPWGFIEPYARNTLASWWQGLCLLKICDGHVTDTNWISMQTLENRYA